MSTTLSMTELRRMTPDELRRELLSTRAEYTKTRMKVKMEGEKNHSKVKKLRRSIAQMEMALREARRTVSQKPNEDPSQKAEKSVQRSRSASKKA